MAEAATAAKAAGPSRNEFYVRAIREHLERIRDAAITDQLNALYDEIGQDPDPFFKQRQLRSSGVRPRTNGPLIANVLLNRERGDRPRNQAIRTERNDHR